MAGVVVPELEAVPELGAVEVLEVVVLEVAGVVVPEVEVEAVLELGVVGELEVEVVYLDIPGQPYNLSLNLIQTYTQRGIDIDLK